MRTRTIGWLLLWAGIAPAWGHMTDPTRPNFGRAGSVRVAPGLRLESVLISPLRRQAVVDGRLVRVGSTVGGATVTRIEQGGIWLRRPGGMTHLRLVRMGSDDIRKYGRGGGS
ncbi:MAG TPA: hypothetical protein VFN52_04455 [Acidiferrobacteraceae bacterium]|nr:hypothetical protein [Acidiferrobacteraceae bacterium]